SRTAGASGSPDGCVASESTVCNRNGPRVINSSTQGNRTTAAAPAIASLRSARSASTTLPAIAACSTVGQKLARGQGYIAAVKDCPAPAYDASAAAPA